MKNEDIFPDCNCVWQKLFRLKTLFTDLEKCDDDDNNVGEIYTKLRVVKTELQDIVEESLHQATNYQKQSREIAKALQLHLEALNTTASHLEQALNGKDSSSTNSSAASETSAQLPESNRGFLYIVNVTEGELNNVPGYLKGRLTLTQINECVKMINLSATKKYEMMKKSRNQLKHKEKIMVDIFKKQNTAAVKGTNFITADDLREFAGFKFNTSNSSIFMVLRHLRKIKEVREPQEPIRYTIL